MHAPLFTLLAFFLVISASNAQTDSLQLSISTSNTPSFILTDPKEVLLHDGDLITVEGCVVRASLKEQVKGKPIFMDMFAPYPENVLTIAIWEEDQAQFLSAAEYQQKKIRVTGRAKKKSYAQAGQAPKERVTISLHNPNQISILGDCQ